MPARPPYSRPGKTPREGIRADDVYPTEPREGVYPEERSEDVVAVARRAGSKRQTAVAAHRPAATAPQTAEPFWALFAQGSTSELGGR